MLESLRTAAGSWVAKALLALLVMSFAVWGISGQMLGGFASNTVITAGGTTVSALDYRLAWDRQISVLSQRLGQRLTREQAEAMGVDGQVLAQLVAGAVLDEQAREMRLGVSKERLAALVMEDPAFQGPDGKYNREQFDYVLRQVGMRPEDYLKNREQVAIRQQIVEAATDGLKTPDAFLTAVALYRGEDRTVDYVIIPRTSVEPVADPAADVLAKWFDEHKTEYAAPEFRKIAYAKLEPADIADPAAIADAQVREDYEKNKARYTTAEKRAIEQIVFKDEAAAKKAEADIRAGSTTFDDVIKAEGKTPADVALGTLTKSEVVDKALAEAAFGLAEGAISAVLPGTFGPVLLRVTKIEPEIVQEFDTVKDAIRNELALAEAAKVLLDTHDAYEDARAGGDSLEEAATKVKLNVVTVEAVSRTGETPDGAVLKDIPEQAKLLDAAFESDVDVENPALPIGSTGFVFYEVKSVTAARDRTLDEVKDKVVAAWKAEEANRLLSVKAEDARKKLAGGTPFDVVAAELGLTKQTKRGLKRGADDADLGASAVEAAFAVKTGTSGVAGGPNDVQIVFTVIEAIEPAGAGPELVPEEERNGYASAIADDLLDELVSRLRGQYAVTVNEAAIAAAKAN